MARLTTASPLDTQICLKHVKKKKDSIDSVKESKDGPVSIFFMTKSIRQQYKYFPILTAGDELLAVMYDLSVMVAQTIWKYFGKGGGMQHRLFLQAVCSSANYSVAAYSLLPTAIPTYPPIWWWRMIKPTAPYHKPPSPT